MKQIAVLGHGVVGSGVCELLDKNAASINGKAGCEIAVKRILDLRDFPDLPYAGKFTKRFEDILEDTEIEVVVEVMGGVEPAFRFVKSSLEAGKSVVTSNKELVARRGAELLGCAREHNVNFLFEASVGGGIPIIRPLHQCLAANRIDEIAGILNGTTNFILTKMFKEGMPFADALALAQKSGYAEANPAADVEGVDACRKICILASLAFGSHVYPERVHTQGITGITLADVQYAEGADRVIKLVGRTYQADGGVYAIVSPALLHKDSQLGGIDDVFNGILVRGDATGDVVFYGKGAGKLPTASAVIGDVIDCAKAAGHIGSLHWEDSDGDNVIDYRTQPAAKYVRCTGVSPAAVEAVFGKVSYLSRNAQPAGELAFLTPTMQEGELDAKLARLEQDGCSILSAIRTLDY